MEPTQPPERPFTADDRKHLVESQIRQACASAGTKVRAAIAGVNAGDLSLIEQLLSQRIIAELRDESSTLDLGFALRLHDANVRGVREVGRLLDLQKQLDEAAGPDQRGRLQGG